MLRSIDVDRMRQNTWKKAPLWIWCSLSLDSAYFLEAYLLMQVIPAEYAFVLHTANPVTGAKGELFGEAVVGMGEALVGNQPGRALSFSAATGGGQPKVSLLSLPSKRVGLFSPRGGSNVIFRSDSNGEDLEAFAGAG